MNQTHSQVLEKSTTRPLTAILYDPFDENTKNSKAKKEKEGWGFFQRRKKPTEPQVQSENQSKQDNHPPVFRSTFKDSHGKTIDFEVSSFSQSNVL